MAALATGVGSVWLQGQQGSPRAVLVESPLVPGEPRGFGSAEALLDLLSVAGGWSCVEVDAGLAEAMSAEFDRRWTLVRTVIDVVHRLDQPVEVRTHPLVRELTPAEARSLSQASEDLFPDRGVVVTAAGAGRVFAAIDGGVIVGHGGSMATGRSLADVGVHVVEEYRRQGIATAAASLACQALQTAGLTPIWGTGSHNAASLRVAAKLGFVEVARLTYLVRAHG